MDQQVATALRDQILNICFATGFLVAGIFACLIAVMRRRSGVRVFVWLGTWSASYGLLHLLNASAVVMSVPAGLRSAAVFLETVLSYVMVVLGSFAFLSLMVGVLRRVVLAGIVAASLTAVLGIGWFLATGVPYKFLPLNNAIAAAVLSLLIIAMSSRRVFRKFFTLPTRGWIAFGTLLFALEALWSNVTRPFGVRTWPVFDHLGFAALLIAFAYSALRMVFANEHRLLTIESELEVARQIQTSILPKEVPEIRNVQIAATYVPMTAVAGDFYDFIAVDEEHVGIFVADVCGHGVPAALIASMLKVALQSAGEFAAQPGKFLATLNRTLSGPLRGQLVSAAFLWVDVGRGKVLYSAAGHPPLLWQNGDKVVRIESNGLLFGVLPETSYPVRELELEGESRFVLYTDGISDPEDVQGLSFGDGQLEKLLCAHPTANAREVSRTICERIGKWRPDRVGQQDDMTLIVVDVRSAREHNEEKLSGSEAAVPSQVS